MEIIRESTDRCKEFKDIEFGIAFESYDFFYIKMDCEAKIEEDEKVNAVCLNDGETTYFGPTERVKIVNASLVIKE